MLIFGLLSNILQLHNINSNLQLVLKGLIIIGTVLVQERNFGDLLAICGVCGARLRAEGQPATMPGSRQSFSRKLERCT